MQKRAKILLVDDDRDFIEVTRTVLESKPYQVVTATNGDEALRVAKREKPDLILLDIIMPVKDGFTAAEQLKKDIQLKKIPIVMLTSFAQTGQGSALPRARGMGLQTEDYLEKPISPKDLLSAVEKQLKKAGA
ncbi:MAG: response regulator [Chloroflexota bacterium]